MTRIGIVDSGVGGYSIARQIHRHSSVDIVFLADQYHVPYGDRCPEELLRISSANLEWFRIMGIREVLLACNTISPLIAELQEEFADFKLHSVIEITARQFENKHPESLLVLGTKAAIQSGVYQALLEAYLPASKLYFEKCPGLVELIEANVNKKEVISYLDGNLAKYKNSGVKTLLACTHYPIIAGILNEYFGSSGYDSIASCIDLFKSYQGNNEFFAYTSGDPLYLDSQVRELFNDKLTSLKKV